MSKLIKIINFISAILFAGAICLLCSIQLDKDASAITYFQVYLPLIATFLISILGFHITTNPNKFFSSAYGAVHAFAHLSSMYFKYNSANLTFTETFWYLFDEGVSIYDERYYIC